MRRHASLGVMAAVLGLLATQPVPTLVPDPRDPPEPPEPTAPPRPSAPQPLSDESKRRIAAAEMKRIRKAEKRARRAGGGA